MQRHVVALLESQLNAGVVSSYVVTQARVALDGTTLARQAAGGEVGQARIRLAGALGVPPRALRGVRLSFADLREFPRDLTRPQIRRQALLDRADVRQALEQYAASQSALKLEIARQWPDLHLGPGFAWNSQLAEDSEWQLGLSLPLPVLNRNQGPIAEARANRKLAARHFLTVQAGAIEDIDSALAGYRSALAQVATAEALLTGLKQQLGSVRAQVQAGERQPLELADAEVAFDSGAQNTLAARVAAQQALGRLEDAVESPLTLEPSSLRAAQTRTPGSKKP